MDWYLTHSIQRRLILAFGLFSATLLLSLWLINAIYLFFNERVELRHNLQTQAAMIATQSIAAVIFEDRATLQENLLALQQMDNLKWAAVLLPHSSGHEAQERLIAQIGSIPETLVQDLAELDRHNGVMSGFYETIVTQSITHNNIVRGQVIIAVDQHEDIKDFARILLLSLMIKLTFLAIAMLIFHRIVSDITSPVRRLAEIADQASQEGIPIERADGFSQDEIGVLANSFNRMLDNLAARERELSCSRDDLRALSQRLLAIREEERTRIAHEIHDELGQRLTALKFSLARELANPLRDQLTAEVDAAVNTVRNISWELRPSLLDSIGLTAAIEWLAQDFQQRIGIRCGCHLDAHLPVLSPELATDLFRICQELLTNIARHACATRADIRLTADVDSIRLEVSDNGRGMPQLPAQHRSLGLIGLQERSLRWQGHLSIRTRPGDGTAVCVVMPTKRVCSQQESLS